MLTSPLCRAGVTDLVASAKELPLWLVVRISIIAFMALAAAFVEHLETKSNHDIAATLQSAGLVVEIEAGVISSAGFNE